MKYYLLLCLFLGISSAFSGIDVSTWQGSIAWSSVAKNHHFAIIRAGYGIGHTDDHFETNYANAKAAGVRVGAYWYSYASSESDAVQEANSIMSLLAGKQFEWPIYYDIEGDALNGDVNGMATTFCSILQQNNYFCGIYSSAYPLSNQFSQEVLSSYAIWVANYDVEQPSFDGEWGIWQYTSSGSVNGINGNVDMDYATINYADIIISKGFNGY